MTGTEIDEKRIRELIEIESYRIFAQDAEKHREHLESQLDNLKRIFKILFPVLGAVLSILGVIFVFLLVNHIGI